MKPIAEWRRALLSISFWMQIAGMLVLIVPELRFYLTGQDYDPFLAWWASMLLLIAGASGRLLQQGLRWWQEVLRVIGIVVVIIALAFVLAGRASAAPASEQDTLKIAVPFIIKEEGMVLHPYLDIVGKPTVCGGLTTIDGRHVTMSMPAMSREQCEAETRKQIAVYRNKLHRYFTEATINFRLPATRDTAYTSLAYNVGVTRTGHSTAVARLNSGNVRGGCQALTWWNKAGTRLVRALFNRRKREEAMCLIGA